jgi:hypothetical protein
MSFWKSLVTQVLHPLVYPKPWTVTEIRGAKLELVRHQARLNDYFYALVAGMIKKTGA